MRLIRKILPFGVGIVLGLLFITFDLSWLLVAGIILTTASAGATWITLSVVRKIKAAFGEGDYKTNRAVDATHENRVPPIVLRPSILALNDLGFRRLGEELTMMADGKELGCEWVFVSADGQVLANLVPARGIAGGFMAAFQTIFPNYAWQRTYYPSGFPQGKTITLPNLRLRHTKSSLQGAYELHRTELSDFAQQHGEPVRIDTMSDYLVFDPVFRERYMGLTLRRGFQLRMLHPYVWGGSTLLYLIGTLLSGIAPAAAIMIFVLGFSALCLYLSYMLPAHLRAARLLRVAIGLLLVLLPLSFMWHGFVLLHNLLLSLLLVTFNRYVPADAKAFADEIKSGKQDVDWQGLQTGFERTPEKD